MNAAANLLMAGARRRMAWAALPIVMLWLAVAWALGVPA